MRVKGSLLFLEEIVEGLTMTIHHFWSGTTPFFFHKHLRFEKRTEIIRAFVDYALLQWLGALVAG